MGKKNDTETKEDLYCAKTSGCQKGETPALPERGIMINTVFLRDVPSVLLEIDRFIELIPLEGFLLLQFYKP